MIQKLGLKLVTIHLPFRLNHVNCLIGNNDEGHVILDTGLHNDETIKVWRNLLRDKIVTHIIVSHLHPDHSGYAGRLQQLTGAEVSMPEMDALAMKKVWQNDPRPFVKKDYQSADVPDELTGKILNNIDNFRELVSPFPTVTKFLNEKDVVQIGKEEYEVIATPGHSPGLVTFYNRTHNVLLSTDHILPRITPNISYWFYGEKNPLKSYEQSLKKSNH